MLEGQLIWCASANMADNDDAGGQRALAPIPDNQVANIHGPIADLDRVTGFTRGKKVYWCVDTHDAQTLYRPAICVDKPPADRDVSITLLYTADWFDTWGGAGGARETLETYLSRGARWAGRLLEKQIAGSRSIQVYQRPELELPAIGDVFVLVSGEGTSGEREQYLRVQSVADAVRTFTLPISGGGVREVKFRVLTIEISEPLEMDFDGGAFTDLDTVSPPATIRGTVVADAVNVYGVSALASAGNVGETTLAVESIFAQIVPSSRSWISIVDVDALGRMTTLADAGNGFVSFTTAMPLTAATPLFLGSPCWPGSFTLTAGAATLADDGKGGVYAGLAQVASIDYAQGIVTMASSAPGYSGQKAIAFKAAVSQLSWPHSMGIAVTLANRSLSYNATLRPIPAGGALVVAYRALGKWYTLADDGSGVCRGIYQSYGLAQLRRGTGSVEITLGALPDIGSHVLIFWGAPWNLQDRSGIAPGKAGLDIHVQGGGIGPLSVSLAWDGGAAQDDGRGALVGDATGEVFYAGSLVRVRPNALPPKGTAFTLTYGTGGFGQVVEAAPVVSGDGLVHIQIPPDAVPGSVLVEFTVVYRYTSWGQDHENTCVISIQDNGTGGFNAPAANPSYPFDAHMDYANGLVSINPSTYFRISRWVLNDLYGNFSWAITETAVPAELSGGIKTVYRSASVMDYHTVTKTLDSLSVWIDFGIDEAIVPGVRFVLGGKTYIDKAGQLYMDVDPASGVGPYAGLINYQARLAALSDWAAGAANSVAFAALSSTPGERIRVDSVVFRIPAAPVNPGSIQVLAERASGQTLSFTVPNTGIIDLPYAQGTGDADTGVVQVSFGAWVDPAGHEYDWWFLNAAPRPSDGKVFRRDLVYSDSIRYNAVAFSYLPMSKDKVGVNVNKFPADGRVPQFRKGDVVLVHHEEWLDLAGPIAPNAEYLAPRDRLARVEVWDANGVQVVAGSNTWGELRDETHGLQGVKFAPSLNLSPYVQPFRMLHRVEDFGDVTQTPDISGQLTINRPLSHAYPAGESYVSSCIVPGTRQARVTNLFVQETWLGHWLDVLEGNEPLLKFNDTDYPIEVWNDSAVEEDWLFRFVTPTTYHCYGYHLGLVDQNISINDDYMPINRKTGRGYFKVRAGAFGLGGAAGNAVRFKTLAGTIPVWVNLTVQPGNSTVTVDGFNIYARGNAA
jgi:hypothetical protein